MSVIDQGAQLDEGKLQDFVFRVVGEVGATLNTALVVMGDKLGSLPGDGGRGAADSRRAGRTHRHRRTVRAGMAECPGSGRLRQL